MFFPDRPAPAGSALTRIAPARYHDRPRTTHSGLCDSAAPASFGHAARADKPTAAAVRRSSGYTLTSGAYLSLGTNRIGARILACSIYIAILALIARLAPARIRDAALVWLTRLSSRTTAASASVRADAGHANLAAVTSDRIARIHAGADTTNLAMWARDPIARPHALSRSAFQARRARDFGACRFDAKPTRRTDFPGRTNEFPAAALRYARALIAGFSRRADIALVRGSIAIVIDSVAGLGRRRARLQARDHAILTLHRPFATNSIFTSITRRSATGARDTCDERRQIVEIVIAAGKEIFPAEVKRPIRHRAVVDEQVDEWARLLHIRVVLRLAIENIVIGAQRIALLLDDAFVKPDLAPGIIRVILDVEHLGRSNGVRASEELVQFGAGRLTARDVVPAKRVVVTGIALEHCERKGARGDEPFGRLRCARQGIDVFAAVIEEPLETITLRNGRTIRLVQCGHSVCAREYGQNDRNSGLVHSV